MDIEQARAKAAQAEELADRIEATTAETPDREAQVAVTLLLLGGDGLPLPFDLAGAVEAAERVFDGWGWDVIKWPRGEGGASMEEPPPEGTFIFDAEVIPAPDLAPEAAGRSLIGQHSTAGGALLAATLRGYAFKVLQEAGALEPPDVFGPGGEVNLDITDEERAFIADIIDRAEELELSLPSSRVDRMMDIAATHKNGCPLDLESFLHHATDFAFTHDFCGIVENIDRSTGKLGGEFLPKYAQAEPVAEDAFDPPYHEA